MFNIFLSWDRPFFEKNTNNSQFSAALLGSVLSASPPVPAGGGWVQSRDQKPLESPPRPQPAETANDIMWTDEQLEQLEEDGIDTENFLQGKLRVTNKKSIKHVGFLFDKNVRFTRTHCVIFQPKIRVAKETGRRKRTRKRRKEEQLQPPPGGLTNRTIPAPV